MIRKLMTWLQWTCCIGWLWVPSHQATQSLLLSSMDLNCHAEMASSSLRYMIGNMYNVSSLTFISRFSNHSWVAESFMARVYTSHIASYKAIVDHLMVTEAHWSDLETIQQALGDTSLLLKAMFLGFLQGKGVPCPNLSPPSVYISPVSSTYLALKKMVFRQNISVGRQQAHTSWSWMHQIYR